MSNFSCPIVEIKDSEKHPNADALFITEIMGSTCIFKTGQFQKGDWAVYIPMDAVVPLTHKAFEWLKDPNRQQKMFHRVKAKRLRGIFSDGFLVPMSDLDLDLTFDKNPKLDDDMAAFLGITKYEEPMPIYMNTGNRKDPGFMPIYDMESWRKNKNIIEVGEEVVITEKLHGCNFRACYRDGEVFVGSRNTIKKENETNLWWKAAYQIGLPDKLKQCENIAIYGEIYGQVQDLHYDTQGIAFAAFDAYDTIKRHWLSWDEFVSLCTALNIPMVPVLYRGPYTTQELINVVEPNPGAAPLKSAIATCIREGAVIKTTEPRRHQGVGRVQLKLVSEAYLLRKNGTEFH